MTPAPLILQSTICVIFCCIDYFKEKTFWGTHKAQYDIPVLQGQCSDKVRLMETGMDSFVDVNKP